MIMAMLLLVLVTTLAAGMVWQQRRAIEVEAGERTRSQAAWILRGATDWARLIVREDHRAAQRRQHYYTWDRDAWGTPLAEASLRTFLAAEANSNADGDVDAVISGALVDAQSRFNLRLLIDGQGKVQPGAVAGLQRLADAVGAPGNSASRLAEVAARAVAPTAEEASSGLRPERLEDFAWHGLEPEVLRRLAPYVDLLPVATTVNVNTAPREVLLAVLEGIDPGTAERLVQRRQRQPFETLDQLRAWLGEGVKAEEGRVSVSSNWFEARGRLRVDQLTVEEVSLLQRDGDRVSVRRRQRHASTPIPG